MSCSLDRSESKPSKFPDHSSNLVLMFMDSGNPPFSPRLNYRDTVDIFDSLDPPHGSGDGNIGIMISREDEDANVGSDETWVNPL